MADELVRHLKQKVEASSDLQPLWIQWGFDQQVIPRALQTIVSWFPHYSRHDESHSKQILTNIERLLGNDLILLSATDTWLILETAYLHDIGMVVSHSDLNEALLDEEFKRYLQSIKNDEHHELCEFAKSLANLNATFISEFGDIGKLEARDIRVGKIAVVMRFFFETL